MRLFLYVLCLVAIVEISLQQENNDYEKENSNEEEINDRSKKLKEYVEAIGDSIKEIKRITKLEDATQAKPKQYFKTYEQIKKTLEEVNIYPKTDSEIIRGLFDKYIETSLDDEESILLIMEDLEYLGHHYDNALEFIRMDGMHQIIYKNLNASSTSIRDKSLILLGTLCQNNIKVQIHAVESGALTILQKILDDKLSNQISLYALGSILRQFPWAQKKFLQTGGLATLSNLLERSNIKLRLKTAMLLDDLMKEFDSALLDGDDDEKIKQYKEIDLKSKLLQMDYCKHAEKLLADAYNVDESDLDFIGKCVDVIEGVLSNCYDSYSSNVYEYLKIYKSKLGDDVVELNNAVKDEL